MHRIAGAPLPLHLRRRWLNAAPANSIRRRFLAGAPVKTRNDVSSRVRPRPIPRLMNFSRSPSVPARARALTVAAP